MVKRFLTISTLSYVQADKTILLLVKTTTSKQLFSFVRLMGDIEYEGTVKWGVTSQSYLPKDNTRDFDTNKSILDWLRQFASKGRR